MTNELTPYSGKYSSEENFDLVAKSGDWLPRLQLFGSNSDAVKKAIFPMAHWGLVKDANTIEDLGGEVNIIPFSWRPKAMRMGESNSAPVSYYNPKNEEFRKIQIDSELPNSGCMFGPEFLIWIPAAAKFATLFLSSKTSRRESPNLMALLKTGKAATLKVKYIETARYSWHGPVVTTCSVPLETPSINEINNLRVKFDTPDESSIEFNPEEIEKESRAR